MLSNFEEVTEWGVVDDPTQIWSGGGYPAADTEGRRAVKLMIEGIKKEGTLVVLSDDSIVAPISSHLPPLPPR
eukprot:5746477-Prymnesium_polylepis.1